MMKPRSVAAAACLALVLGAASAGPALAEAAQPPTTEALTVATFNASLNRNADGELLTDLATGTGIGFRYDINLLVFRFDIGYALHFPYDTGRRGYLNAPNLRDALGFHLALGYPF